METLVGLFVILYQVYNSASSIELYLSQTAQLYSDLLFEQFFLEPSFRMSANAESFEGRLHRLRRGGVHSSPLQRIRSDEEADRLLQRDAV